MARTLSGREKRLLGTLGTITALFVWWQWSGDSTVAPHGPAAGAAAAAAFDDPPRVRMDLLAREADIDESKCTGCRTCASVCPIEVSNPFDLGLSTRKATYRFSAQSVPGAYAIQKKGIAPCRSACPTDQRAQGYIALIRQQRYADAYWAIRREHPFPSVCGRVCNHRCEDACSRGKYDDPVNVMGLKRFVSDWAYQHRDELPNLRDKSIIGTQFQHNPPPTGKKVAVIGAGPAGLTAALDLVRWGMQ